MRNTLAYHKGNPEFMGLSYGVPTGKSTRRVYSGKFIRRRRSWKRGSERRGRAGRLAVGYPSLLVLPFLLNRDNLILSMGVSIIY